MEKDNHKASAISPHFWWSISLLIVVVIGLVTYIIFGKMYQGSIVIEYLNTAGMLLSITLSIFAIQYTYHSNNRAEHQVDKIVTAADNIIDTGNRMNKELDDFRSSLDRITKMQENMNSKIENQNNKLENSNQANNIIKAQK